MEIYLLRCPICGKMFKCFPKTSINGLQFITDYGDNITNYCINCKQRIKSQVIKTEDWISNLVFKVKGN